MINTILTGCKQKMFPLSDLSGHCIIFNEVNCVNLECDLLIFTAGEAGISNHQDKNWKIGEYWAMGIEKKQFCRNT